MRRETKALLDAEEPDDKLEVEPRRDRVSLEEAIAMRDRLKDDQSWMFTLLTEAIEDQHKQDLPAQNELAVCEFLTGVGGTGKSDLIGALRAWLTCRFESSRSICVVSAPTGIAATSIHGYTIHSILRFEVQQGGIGQYLPLPDSKRSVIASQMKDVRLLILDECSMFSNVMLMKLHRRLCEIGNPNFCRFWMRKHEVRLNSLCCLGFGGFNLLLAGDLLQLPPVMASPIYQMASSSLLRRIFSTVLQGINLWRLFNY
jgi:hypothetical protein